MRALEVSEVCAGYGGEEVLHHVSFSLEEGRSLAVLGPNGSGKSTLLRAVAGLLPFRGNIRIFGEELRGKKRAQIARLVALMSQFVQEESAFTVEETVALGRYVHLEGRLFSSLSDEDWRVVEECICASGLKGLEDKQLACLSGGQLQRVYQARALAQQAEVILLDEPTSHLDLRYQAEAVEYMRGWAAGKRRAAVGVMHDLALAVRFADDVLFLKDGEMVAYGELDRIWKPDLLREVYGMDVAGYLGETLEHFREIGGKRKGRYRSPYEAYPFLADEGRDLRCDVELLTDELASLAGLLRSLGAERLPEGEREEAGEELARVCELIYHANPTLRTRMTVTVEEVEWLREKVDGMRMKYDCGRLFVLPCGSTAACTAHLLRVKAKELVRLLYRHEEQGNETPKLLIDFCNLLSGYFYGWALRLNRAENVGEREFFSRNYRRNEN